MVMSSPLVGRERACAPRLSAGRKGIPLGGADGDLRHRAAGALHALRAGPAEQRQREDQEADSDQEECAADGGTKVAMLSAKKAVLSAVVSAVSVTQI
jgi:hypothetical protein